MTDLNTARHTITEHPMTTFWRSVNADLARRGIAPASGGEISHEWITTMEPAEAAARIVAARKPVLTVMEGGQ